MFPSIRSFAIAGFALLAPVLLVNAQSVDGRVVLDGQPFRVETVATGLNRPWGLAFLPGGDLLVTEKNGRLQRLPGGRGPARAVAGLPADLDTRLETPIDNTGLFDIALAPDFARSGQLVLSYASEGGGGSALAVTRFRLDRDRLVEPKPLLLAGPYSRDRFHYGGALLPLADGTLLVSSGERFAFEKAQGPSPVAQDLRDLRGKLLRIDFDGSAPKDNPFAGRADADSRVYALGVRSPQGLARTAGGTVWFTDHGARRGDELNRLMPGGNYGWPQRTCGEYKDRDYRPPSSSAGMVTAVACWSEITYAPAGLVEYAHPRIPAWQGSLLVAGLSSGYLLRIVPGQSDRPSRVVSLFEDDPQRLRDVAVAPDGAIYLAVDGEQGRIVRLVPDEAQ